MPIYSAQCLSSLKILIMMFISFRIELGIVASLLSDEFRRVFSDYLDQKCEIFAAVFGKMATKVIVLFIFSCKCAQNVC